MSWMASSSSSSSSSSSRWCPTPEQLMILEEMYRMGIHTPSTSQIQQITAQLSSYGKIEGKNVFYWFQNHKARDRQRLRRKLSRQLQLGHNRQYHNHQLCFHLPPNPQQQQLQQCQILNHQRCSMSDCFARYVNQQSPSHSPGSAYPQHCTCCSPNSFLQGGKIGSKRLTGGTFPNERANANKTAATRIRGLLDCMLTVDVNRSRLQYHPQPLKTLDLFPTTSSNLGEERNPQGSFQGNNY
ncbi:hypothetical protein MLD38_009627 [Melastoma candidum]|uniref:Uncharacterized protein n=1 Tax=Melastoma candidum TaxID=119954 RepID=A0ACB9RY39_9MYRT|nr:hypothetical protein MLD38_009627 [Melastoma candidum]